MQIVIAFLLVVSLFNEGTGLSEKNSSNLCDEIILQQYNVNSTICSSKFVIIPSTSTYTIDEPIHITIEGVRPDATFIGFHLSAQDENNAAVGSWKTTDELIDGSSCGVGLMSKSEVDKTHVDAIWHVSSKVVGNILIKATIIENDKTVYINCYNLTLTPRVRNNSSLIIEKEPGPNTTTTITTSPSTLSTTSSTTTRTTTTLITTTSVSTNTTRAPSPTAEVTVNVTWTFIKANNVTNVFMTIKNLKAAQWTAIGLGQAQAMGEAHVFMCKRLANDTVVIHRYMNPGKHDPPEAAGPEQGGLLTPGALQFSEGVVMCQFNLSNFPTETFGQPNKFRPLSQSGSYHPLIAIGELDDTNEPNKHAKDSRIAKSDLVQLNQNEVILYRITVDADDLTYLRTHGIIMIFTWILIVSTGVLISRYFKNSWIDTLICGKAAWFAAHRLLMSMAAVLTTIGFLFVLIYTQGTWVDQGPTRLFAHSITGVLVISFAFFQPFIALFRCEPDSRYRFIFNYIHGFVGFSAFILATATLFLATYFHVFKDNRGRIVMIVWIGWVALVFTVFEIIQSYHRKKNGGAAYSNINASNTTLGGLVESPTSPTAISIRFDNQQEATVEQKSKNILLAIHILVATTLSVLLATLIL